MERSLGARDDRQLRSARDLALIEAYRSGREEAFEDLVRAYQPAVARILARLNVPASDVEDLTQDVFLRIFRNLHRFRGQSSFYTWLYRITVNVFFDQAKKGKRAEARRLRLQDAMSDASLGVPPSDDEPFRAAYEHVVSEGLRAAIARLPEPFRTVVALREVDDLSYEEIANTAGVSVGTIRSRLSRARSRLRALLRPSAGAAA